MLTVHPYVPAWPLYPILDLYITSQVTQLHALWFVVRGCIAAWCDAVFESTACCFTNGLGMICGSYCVRSLRETETRSCSD